MSTIQNILFPVDFSASCVALAPYVKRAAAILEAKVTLLHVFDLPVEKCPRKIVHLARTDGFDLIIMPTHAGFFRRTLLGPLSTPRPFPRERHRMGRSPESGALGRIRDLSYAVVRYAPCPVLSL